MPEQGPEHSALSYLANTVSFARFAYSFYQAARVRATRPDERTWRGAIRSVIAAGSDSVDGISARAFGSTERGPGYDRLADVAFFGLGDLALAANGEIGPLHSVVDVVRESGVNLMRHYAITHGQPPIKVGPHGKEKTFIKTGAIALFAMSPLSKYQNAKESAISFGTAYSLISGAEYTNKFWRGLRGVQDEPKEPTNMARNGRLRESVKPASTGLAHWVHENLPWVTPTMVTWGSEVGVAIAGALTVRYPSWGFPIAAGLFTPFSLGDKLDGDLAREKDMVSRKGMIRDAVGDRRQEIITATALSIAATKKGNSVASRQFAVAGATASLSALARAQAEMKGRIVDEDAVGSRVTRAIEGGIGVGFNGSRDMSNIVSALMVSGNLITFRHRADVVLRGSKSPHYRGQNNDPEFMEDARLRRNALARMALTGIAVGAGLIVHDVIKSRSRSLVRA